MADIDPSLLAIVLFALLSLITSAILRYLRQPNVIAYILVGILLGSSGLKLVNVSILSEIGNLGIILLMFFIGTEITLSKLLSNWRVAIFGTFVQITLSVLIAWFIGLLFNWSLQLSVLIGFVISLSSTAVVFKMLQQRGELDTKVGNDILGILLVQDLAVIPMLIILGYLGGYSFSQDSLTFQIIGGFTLVAIMMWMIHKKGDIKLAFIKPMQLDHETEVFVAILMCFGFALFAGLFGLSTALGAFVAGIIVWNSKSLQWIHQRLAAFRVVFVASFFVYIGALIDMAFLTEHIFAISLLVLAVFATNTFINASVFRMLGDRWKESLYSGALLSQIGEFSFVLGTFGLQNGIIKDLGYHIIIIVIAITLLLSPFWVILVKRLTQADMKRYSLDILEELSKDRKFKYKYH